MAAWPVLAQVVIAVFGLSAVWLVNHADPKARRWGPVCGLLAQPAWVYTTYVHEQWAILALTAVYTLAWWKGVRTYWLKGRG